MDGWPTCANIGGNVWILFGAKYHSFLQNQILTYAKASSL